MFGKQSLGQSVHVVLSKRAMSEMNKFSAKQWHLHEDSGDTLAVIE